MNSVQHQKHKQHASSLDRIEEEEEKNTTVAKKSIRFFATIMMKQKVQCGVVEWSGEKI